MLKGSVKVVKNQFGAAADQVEQRASIVVGKSTMDLEGHIKANIVAVGAVDTGTMLNETQAQHDPGSLEGAVTNATDYWQHVNYGTHKMAARPVVEPAVDAVAPSFHAAMQQVVEQP